MAKSLRSKIKRKFRSVKRERYAKKELTRLKDMIKKSEDKQAEMTEELPFIVKKRPHSKAKKRPPPDEKMEEIDNESMDVSKPKPKVDQETLKTEHGNYPVWMNQRQIRKKKREVKKIAKERARKKRQKV